MRLLTPGTGSESAEGCPRIWLSDDGGLLVQLYEAPPDAADRIAPCYVPAGEVLGTMPREVLLEAARNLEAA
jgi:hypothetical protein